MGPAPYDVTELACLMASKIITTTEERPLLDGLRSRVRCTTEIIHLEVSLSIRSRFCNMTRFLLPATGQTRFLLLMKPVPRSPTDPPCPYTCGPTAPVPAWINVALRLRLRSAWLHVMAEAYQCSSHDPAVPDWNQGTAVSSTAMGTVSLDGGFQGNEEIANVGRIPFYLGASGMWKTVRKNGTEDVAELVFGL